MGELNKASLEGIGAARQASPLFEAESGVATGDGAGVVAGVVAGFGAGVGAGFGAGVGAGEGAGFGAGVVVGGFVAVVAGGVDDVIGAAGVVVESLEEPAPQPLSTEIRNRSVS
ncbi:MAG TPA: hypothetical protein VGI32_06925 [Steroidobacteraceae bacterium]